MTQEDLDSLDSGQDTILHEAIEALRSGNRERARDLLTRLLKADQNNANYWLWLSAAVDTPRERVYCLQSALRLDPENEGARRGLILFGARAPDENITPFPVNRPRTWEEKLVVPKETAEKPRGWANPVTRLFIILGIAVVAMGLFLGGYMLFGKGSRPASLSPRWTLPRLPTYTMTQTPSTTPLVRTPTPTFVGATPLAFFLEKTYTATPLYVNTQHPVISRASYEAGLRSLAAGQYHNARVQFEDVLKSEPNAVDVYYYIGETYRIEGNFHSARDNYQEVINKGINFAPAFLGRARANLGLNPNADILSDLDEAIRLDPKFAEAYIERGRYMLEEDPAAAATDLQTAIELAPASAPAYLYLAQAQLAQGEYRSAANSAEIANSIDMTIVPVYLALARAYIGTGQIDKAVAALQTYTIYAPNDSGAFLTLGTAYNNAGQYDSAVDILTRALNADKKNAEAYYQRGRAYLELEKPSLAAGDFKLAVTYDPLDFDSHLGLARAYYMQGKPGDAYVQAEVNAVPLAKTDWTKAQVYYWQSLFLHDMKDLPGERASWNRLLALPPDVMPAEWRQQAYEALGITATPTKTLKPTITPTPTHIPSYTPTPTK